MTLKRSSDQLIVSFQTVAPPAPPMQQVLVAFDRPQLKEAMIEVRHRPNRSARAVARGPDTPFKPVAVEVAGREVVVRAPLNELTRRRAFKWRATSVTKGEIVDRVPSRINDVNFFPR